MLSKIIYILSAAYIENTTKKKKKYMGNLLCFQCIHAENSTYVYHRWKGIFGSVVVARPTDFTLITVAFFPPLVHKLFNINGVIIINISVRLNKVGTVHVGAR